MLAPRAALDRGDQLGVGVRCQAQQLAVAEVARLAPAGKVADATAGSTIFIFLGYVAGPSIFATLVSLTGSWTLPQTLVAAQLLLASALVGLGLRKPRQGGAFP